MFLDFKISQLIFIKIFSKDLSYVVINLMILRGKYLFEKEKNEEDQKFFEISVIRLENSWSVLC